MTTSRRRWVPYALLAPGAIWLLLFFAIPMGFMLLVSLQEGSLSQGFDLTWNFAIYPEVFGEYWDLMLRSVVFAFLTTLITLLIGYPLAYTIAFRGGRFKNALLLIVVMPFFVSFVIRTLNWKLILAVNNGKPLTGAELDARLEVQGDHFAVQGPIVWPIPSGTFKLNEAASPNSIDLTSSDGKVALGIYEVRAGNRIRFCLAPPGADRPSKFESRPSSGHYLQEWTRVK